MFDKKDTTPIGAKEKIRQAIEAHHAGDHTYKSGYRGKEQDDTLPVMIAIGGIACAAVLLLMEFRFANGAPFRLPDPALNRLLLGMPPPSFAGDKDINKLIAMLIRGVAFFLVAGIVPGFVKIISWKQKPSLGQFWMVSAILLALLVLLNKII